MQEMYYSAMNLAIEATNKALNDLKLRKGE